MGVEDQKEEREVLDSIFPEEIAGKVVPSNLLGTMIERMHRCL